MAYKAILDGLPMKQSIQGFLPAPEVLKEAATPLSSATQISLEELPNGEQSTATTDV
jgi:hypothetical protein